MKPASQSFTPKTFLHASALLFVCGNLATFIQFVYQSIMRRGLPTGDFSLVNSLFSLSGFLTLPMAFLMPVMARKWAELRARGEIALSVKYLYRTSIISLLYGLLIAGVMYFQMDFLKHFLNTGNEAAIRALLWGLILMQAVAMATVFLQGMQAFGLLAIVALASPVVRLVFGDLWVKAGYGAAGGVWATNVQNLVSLFAVLWFLGKRGLLRTQPAQEQEVKHWQFQDFWIPAMALTVLCILVHTDFVMVRQFFSPAASDRFATAALFGHGMIFFLQPISSVLLPKVVDHFEGWEKAEEKISRKALALSFGLAVFMAIVGTLLAEPVLTLFAGRDDPATLRLVQLFLWAMIPSALASICLNALVARLQARLILICLGASLILPLWIVWKHDSFEDILMAHFTTGTVLLLVIVLGNLGRLNAPERRRK
jgi:O-antigen/teichoic acid export membrane protein